MIKKREEAIRQAKLNEENKKIRTLGFARYAFGYSFPSLNKTKIDLKFKQLQLLAAKGKKEVKKDPLKIYIKPILTNGSIPFEFNQEMLSPTKSINQKVYGHVLKFKIKS